MSDSFHCFEHAVDAIAAKHPGTPRQEVILTRLYYHVLPRLSAPLLAALKPYGLNEASWMSLLALYAQPDFTLNPCKLSETLDFSRTNVTRVADELEKNGWVTRQPSAEDGRKIALCLTATAHALIAEVLPQLRDHQRQLWSGFSEVEKVAMEALLRKLLTQLEGLPT